MAWGVWNKIKQGLRKAGNFAKKGVDFVADNVIKPFKPLIGAAASAINPTAGMVANTAMGAIETLSDASDSWGSAKGAVSKWASSKGWK